MEGLPLLPGYTFEDPTITKYHVSHKFDFKNGYAVPRPTQSGIGKRPLDVESVAYANPLDPVRYDPSLTYGRVKEYALPQFLPHFALYDKKALTFKAFFKQSVFESPNEHYRIRHVNIIYFLEDDTITVMEPPVENSGFIQGRLVKRGKIPKSALGDFWHWKDFNLGMDVAFFGIVYHIVNCDAFTREYLESQGVELSAEEDMPPDPYIMERRLTVKPKISKTPSVDDTLRRFLEYDRKILRFYAVWDNRDEEFGELQPYIVYYYLTDDTVEVQEKHEKNDGRDPFPLLLKRIKLPKNWKDRPVDFPSLYLELTDEEVSEYYSPKDFMIGNTIFILGRRFLLYDCDPFTRNYYVKALNIVQGNPIEVFQKKPPPPQITIPPHIGFGDPEDSLRSCFSLQPQPPKKDVIRYVLNANKYLRYTAKMDWVHPEDEIRRFVILYALFDCTITISEPPIRNSGIIGGKFLAATRIPKPGTDPDYPEYYTPADLYIGATITVFKHRFIIDGADLMVYRYMEANPQKFNTKIIDNVRNYMLKQGLLKEDVQQRTCDVIKEQETAAKYKDCNDPYIIHKNEDNNVK